MMQSGANQSLKGYSLLCGKEQGISRLLRTSDPHLAAADPRDHSGFPENSLESGTGKFHNGSGNSNSLILGPIRELLAGVRVRPQKAAGPQMVGAPIKKLRGSPGGQHWLRVGKGKGGSLVADASEEQPLRKQRLGVRSKRNTPSISFLALA